MSTPQTLLHISTFDSLLSTLPRRVECTWQDLPTVLESLPEGSLWSPFTFKSAKRAKANGDCTQLFVLDFDHASPADLLHVAEWCLARRLAHVWHTTKSHTPDHPAKRLILLLDREVSAQEWPDAWQRMASLFPRLDPKCKDCSRIFYPPRPGASERHAGDVWHWDLETLGRKAFDVTERKLGGKNELLVMACRAVLEGKPWAAHGQRDDVLLKLCTELQRYAYKTPIPALLEVFRASVYALGDADMDWVEEKLKRTREYVEKEALERAEAEEAARAARAKNQLHATGRDSLYSEDEIQAFCARFGYESMTHRWIIQHKDLYYVLCADGEYHLRTSADVKAALPADLAPAGLDLYTVSKSGKETLKPPHEIVAMCGTVANGIATSLTEHVARFNETTRLFVEAPIKAPPVEPQYHEDVHEWLCSLTGDSHKLLSWLKFVTKLDRPCVALALIGSKNTGKSLLACGLARIFNQSAPTNLASLYDSSGNVAWTDGLMRCPLLFSDEKLPKVGHTRNANTEALRELIQDRTLQLRRRFMPDAQMQGCVRLMVAANNDKIFANAGDNTPEDFAATAERFLVLTVGPEATAVLAKHTAEELEVEWKGYKIAEHALWLRDNYAAVPEGRFLIKTDTDLQARLIASQHGSAALVREHIGRFLASPEQVIGQVKYLSLDARGLHVSSKFLDETWDVYMDQRRRITTAEMNRALRSMAGEEAKGPRISANGMRLNTYTLTHEMMGVSLDVSGQGSEDDVDQALRRLTDVIKAQATTEQKRAMNATTGNPG